MFSKVLSCMVNVIKTGAVSSFFPKVGVFSHNLPAASRRTSEPSRAAPSPPSSRNPDEIDAQREEDRSGERQAACLTGASNKMPSEIPTQQQLSAEITAARLDSPVVVVIVVVVALLGSA